MLDDIDTDDLLEDLNEPQQDAVQATEGPVLTLAGAGSGKTRTIVHRIAWLIHVKKVFPRRIVAVTFTNKAAQEMQERTFELAGEEARGCLIRTYHSLGLTFLRKYSRYLDLPDSFTIWDDEDQKNAISSIMLRDYQNRFNKTQLRYFVQAISSLKDELLGPDDAEQNEDVAQMEFGEMLVDIYRKYEELKENSQAVDFADLIYLPVLIFESYPDVLNEIYEHYRYFLVDEYQDTNTAQYTLISLISKHSQNLCVVGDDDQAIYGWRGANVANILNFQKDFPQAKIVKLEQNYRSTQPILDLANCVIKNNPERMEKNLWTKNKEGELPILFTIYDDQQEAKAVANLVDQLRKQVSPEEIAVLYRTNAQSRLLEEYLLSLNIPYRVYGGISFFARKEIKDALSYLKFLSNPYDEISFIRMINTPKRGIGSSSRGKIINLRREKEEQRKELVSFFEIVDDAKKVLSEKIFKTFKKIMTLMDEFAERSQGADLGFLFEDLMTQSGYFKHVEEEDRLLGTGIMENLIELKNSMLRFQARDPIGGLRQYLQEISLLSDTSERSEARGVNLMTAHNSKGLEFSYVLLVGLDENIFPHYLARQEGDITEERRLFYVAVTRAKKGLYLFRSRRRFWQGHYNDTKPSVFLSEIPKEFYKDSYEKEPKPFDTSLDESHTRINFYLPPKGDKDLSKKFKSGDKISHPTFGKGKIFKMEGSGDATKVFIRFDDGKTRKFILKFTQLEKL